VENGFAIILILWAVAATSLSAVSTRIKDASHLTLVYNARFGACIPIQVRKIGD
jgi:hypothetical protein